MLAKPVMKLTELIETAIEGNSLAHCKCQPQFHCSPSQTPYKNRSKRLHRLLVFKGTRKMSPVYKVKIRLSLMIPRQTRGKPAQQWTAIGNDPSLTRIHSCFPDVQISQRIICSFHCSTESVCGGVCVLCDCVSVCMSVL